MDEIKEGNKVLVVWNRCSQDELQNFLNEAQSAVGNGKLSLENSEMLSHDSHPSSTFDLVLSNTIAPHEVVHTDKCLEMILHILKPGGRLVLRPDSDDLKGRLKLNGFVDVDTAGPNIISSKPNFEVGSSMKLGLKNDQVKKAWTLDLDDDIINSDDLLDENDLKKSDPAPPRVCGTTGQRKACADCSCGLAEELKGEVKQTPKSSCGSCYLGDAFRCASCPYLGMPAFKPGEKVLLADLKPDI